MERFFEENRFKMAYEMILCCMTLSLTDGILIKFSLKRSIK